MHDFLNTAILNKNSREIADDDYVTSLSEMTGFKRKGNQNVEINVQTNGLPRSVYQELIG